MTLPTTILQFGDAVLDASIATTAIVAPATAYTLKNRIADLATQEPGDVVLGRVLEVRGGGKKRARRHRRDARLVPKAVRRRQEQLVRLLSPTLRIRLVDRMYHSLVKGPTGGGKTDLLLAMAIQDLRAGLTVFILETGGDFAARLEPYAQLLGRPVYNFNTAPFDSLVSLPIPKKGFEENQKPETKPDPFWRWNPLDGRDDKVAERCAATLAAIGNDDANFFEVHNAITLRAVIYAVKAWARAEGTEATLADVKRLVTDQAFRDDALEARVAGDGEQQKKRDEPKRWTINNRHLVPQARQFWLEFYNAWSNEERGRFLAGLRGSLELILGNPTVEKALCPEGHDWEKVLPLGESLGSGGLVVMKMPLGATGVKTARALSVWCMQAFMQTVLEREGRENNHPVIAYFDEVHNTLGNSQEAAAKDFESWISVVRKLNVGCVFSYQAYGMIPEGLDTVFDTNLRNKLISGGESYAEGERSQKMLGDDIVRVKTQKRSREAMEIGADSVSTTYAEEERDRFAVDELRSLPRGHWVFSQTIEGHLQYPSLVLASRPPSLAQLKAQLETETNLRTRLSSAHARVAKRGSARKGRRAQQDGTGR